MCEIVCLFVVSVFEFVLVQWQVVCVFESFVFVHKRYSDSLCANESVCVCKFRHHTHTPYMLYMLCVLSCSGGRLRVKNMKAYDVWTNSIYSAHSLNI